MAGFPRSWPVRRSVCDPRGRACRCGRRADLLSHRERDVRRRRWDHRCCVVRGCLRSVLALGLQLELAACHSGHTFRSHRFEASERDDAFFAQRRDSANRGERARTGAVIRQAGGHWFEPSTAHRRKPANAGFCFLTGRRTNPNGLSCQQYVSNSCSDVHSTSSHPVHKDACAGDRRLMTASLSGGATWGRAIRAAGEARG